jgi:hypothetical protein
MIVPRPLRFAILVIAGAVTILMTPGCAADQTSAPDGVAAQPGEADGLVAAFQQTHGEILTQVSQGILPAAAGAEAEKLRIALEKYLIRTEAQLEILQLDVLHGTGDEGEAALQRIVALAAERERTKMAYLQRLQALEAGSKPTGEKTGKNGKVKELEIEIKPEDISEGDRP